MIRKLAAFVPCWTFYYIGDIITRVGMFRDWEWPWTIYQGVMLYSSNLQHWAGISDEAINSFWPWSKASDDQT